MILPNEASSSSNVSNSTVNPSTVEPIPPVQSRPGRAWKLWTILANPFTLLSISTLFCVLIFTTIVIDRNDLSSLYPITSAVTIIHHATITIVYRRSGGILYFTGREAPGMFIGIPNLVFLVFLVFSWAGSSIFGSVLASKNTGASYATSLPITTVESALYARLVVCAVLGFLETVIMAFLVLEFLLQRRRAVVQFRERNEKIPMSPV